MKDSQKGQVFKDYIKKTIGFIIFYAVVLAVFFVILKLYKVPDEVFIYSAIITAFIGIIVFIIGFIKSSKKARDRAYNKAAILTDWQALKEPENLLEEDYQEMIGIMGREMESMASRFSSERADTIDYYTTWVHQIKTPIAVLKMQLAESNDTAAQAELFRIEQYVDMVLQYIRLGSESNDLVIKEYELDELLRESIRKYASQFVMRKLRMNFTPTNKTVITDKKWFCCVIDQLISNAIKYTPEGEVKIAIDENNRLLISDTGIGISREDIPRIFEKGFTGSNGRLSERKSSGLGLYLAKRASEKIRVSIFVESNVDVGTTFILDLSQMNHLYD